MTTTPSPWIWGAWWARSAPCWPWMARPKRGLSGTQPAIHVDDLAAHVGGPVRAEEDHHARHLFGFALPLEDGRKEQVAAGLCGHIRRELRVDKPGIHGVHQHAEGSHFPGQALGERDHRALAGAVVGLARHADDAGGTHDVDD